MTRPVGSAKSGSPIPSVRKIRDGFTMIIEGLGLDPNSEHLLETPERAADAFYFELCRGLKDAPPKITTFSSDNHSLILLRDIPIKSLCEHHLLPFVGTAVVGYIPGTGKILGVSKLSRIADHFARRPQVQERLTEQIADFLAALVVDEETGEGGVGVMIQASHFCMMMRGVDHPGRMVTSALRGVLYSKPEARAEFLRLVEEAHSR